MIPKNRRRKKERKKIAAKIPRLLLKNIKENKENVVRNNRAKKLKRGGTEISINLICLVGSVYVIKKINEIRLTKNR